MVRYAQTLETRVHEAFRGQGLLSLLHHLQNHHRALKVQAFQQMHRRSTKQAEGQGLQPPSASAGGALAITEATGSNSAGRQRLTDHRRSVGAWGW